MPVLSSVEALDVGDDDVVLSSVVALLMELPPMSLLYKSSPKDLESWPESEAEAKSSARSCASSSGVFSFCCSSSPPVSFSSSLLSSAAALVITADGCTVAAISSSMLLSISLSIALVLRSSSSLASCSSSLSFFTSEPASSSSPSLAIESFEGVLILASGCTVAAISSSMLLSIALVSIFSSAVSGCSSISSFKSSFFIDFSSSNS
mmetsp:Transcript_7746/g.24278  ORF Transcript_7746/g.24278 Transcript_7746/m.24278 type:complete len:207 (+) Transcript_7746:185-805(+)